MNENQFEHREVEPTVEDLRFLLAHGVGASEAARRMGWVSPKSMERWLSRHGHQELMNQLRAKDWDPLRPSTKQMHMGASA